jgi:hypothetical protein
VSGLARRENLPQIGGKCLTINVFVGGRIDITIYKPEDYCDGYYLNENNSCIIEMEKSFELLPAPVTTLVEFLRSSYIVQALAAMDPSFHSLIRVISNDLYDYIYFDPYNVDIDIMYNSYDIYVIADNIDLSDPSSDRIDVDVTDALHVTLSWVSYNNKYTLLHATTIINAGQGLYRKSKAKTIRGYQLDQRCR